MDLPVGLLERMVPPEETAVDPPSEEQKQRLELWRVFNELGIKPFTDESVAAYKRQMAREANIRALCQNALIVSVCAPAAAFIAFPLHLPLAIKAVELLVFWVFGSFIVIITVGLKGKAQWQQSPYTYHSTMPDDVLERVSKLQAALPGVEVRIYELVQNRFGLDPFLTVTYGEREYYIAVWDEKGFDPTQTQ